MGKEKFLLATLHLVLGAYMYISVGETLQAADLEKLASVSLKPVQCSQTQMLSEVRCVALPPFALMTCPDPDLWCHTAGWRV